MAKKNFRGEMGSMLAESLQGLNLENEQIIENIEDCSPSFEEFMLLKKQNANLRKELKLWRIGKLDTEKFKKSLFESKLKYNETNNQIEEL